MFKQLWNGLLAVMAVKLLENFRQLSLQRLKIETATCYARSLQVARTATFGLMRMALFIALMGVGVLLFHAGLFILLPWSLVAKAVLGMILGVVYLAIGGLALRSSMSEKKWIEKSGLAELLQETTGKSIKAVE